MMKKMLVCSLVFFVLHASDAQTYRSVPIGSSLLVPDTHLLDISGKQVTLKETLSKNGLLVMFSCNTCPYVIKNQSRTKMIAAFAKENQIGVILLNSNEGGRDDGDSYLDMKNYAEAQGYDFLYALDKDSKLANAFGATRTPEVYLFNGQGILQYKGAIDDNPTDGANVKRIHSREAIVEMISGKPISVKESRSLGCGIKRNE